LMKSLSIGLGVSLLWTRLDGGPENRRDHYFILLRAASHHLFPHLS
jgi:hypothetical protein